MDNNKETQEIVRVVIEENLKTKDISKVKQALDLAKTISIPKGLQYKALMAVANHYKDELDYFNAFMYFSNARKYTTKFQIPLLRMVECLNKFFWDNELSFSANDLSLLLTVMDPSATLLKAQVNIDSLSLENLVKTISRINYRIKYTAPDVIETKVTFRTQKIKDAFYTDMTFEEMQTEMAKLITRMIINDEPDEKPEESDKATGKKADSKKKLKKEKKSDDEN
jgi:hypothetical protein